MPGKKSIAILAKSELAGYNAVYSDVAGLLNSARSATARLVNAALTATYWRIGQRIVEWEQGGKERARYGDALLDRLSADLTIKFGRGFSRRAVYQMRAFYLAYPIVQSAIAQSRSVKGGKVQSTIAQSDTPMFPLPWTHYIRLLGIRNPKARAFYEAEALRGGWSVRQLDRQIRTLFYERTALSKDKVAMMTKAGKAKPEDRITAEEQLKDPFVLEFLDLKDEYSETDMEDSLVRHIESFLLEAGRDMAFVGRQKRLRIGDQWFRIDLLFFHRKLRCLVVIDLKIDAFSHADAGQMHMYLNYAAEHWTNDGENPPVGLILCAEKDAAVAKYALGNLPNKILAAEYKTVLPREETLEREMAKTRALLESRAIVRKRS